MNIQISQNIEFFDFFLRFAIAIFCGFLIGFERQWINRVAGIQTNVLVCGGACIFILSSYFVSYEGQSASRIAAQIVSGIGFLGAGMIFREGISTHGINTAATIWCAAAVGVLCGMGLLPHALGILGLLILSNIFFRKLDHIISKNRRWKDLRMHKTYEIELITSNQGNKELREKFIELVNIDDHTIVGVKTNFMRKGFIKITIIFKSHESDYMKIQSMIEKINELDSEMVVEWSQI